jgi:SNF2 family DNA or RNA helicase
MSDSTLINKWIGSSVSRVWAQNHWAYPLTELQEFFDFAKLVEEPVRIDPAIDAQFSVFKEKVVRLMSIKETIKNNCDFKIWDPVMQVKAPPTFTSTLKFYQPGIIAQMLLMHRYMVAIEMGLGKTVVSLFGALKVKSIKPNAKILLVCEANAIHKPWIENVQQHTTIMPFVHIVSGCESPEDRKRKIQEGLRNPDKWFWVVSYDTFRTDFHNDVQSRKDGDDLMGFPMKWDVIIYDEITKAKNIGSKTSKALVNLMSDYIWGLSGTPIINTYFDLYGVMKLINPQVFTTKQNFTEKYLTLDFFKRPVGLRKSMIGELKKKLEPWYCEAVKADFGLEKKWNLQTIRVPLTKIQTDQLNLISEKIENQETSLFENATNIRRLCNTAKVFDKWKDCPITETTNKFTALVNLLDDVITKQGKKVLVFSFFKTVIDLLAEELKDRYVLKTVTGDIKKSCPEAEIEHCIDCARYKKCSSIKKVTYDFESQDTKLLLGTDTLQKAHNFPSCDTIINFDLPWTSAELKQRIGRIDRITSKFDVLNIYNIITEATIEDKVMKVIEQKEKDAGKVLVKYSVQLTKLSKTIRVRTTEE